MRVEGSARTPFPGKHEMNLTKLNSMRRMSKPRGALLALMVLGLSSGAWGCSDMASDTPLSNARNSPEALARAALEAVQANDHEALSILQVTREEYETLLWPSLPDREYMPFDFVWSLTGPRSRKARTEVLGEYGGIPLELVRVTLGDEVEEYPDFILYREARMTVRRTDTGAEGEFPLMDVLVFMGDGWKFLNFIEDV